MSDYIELPSFELPPAGTQDAVCVAWLDVGSHKNKFFGQGQNDREFQRKLMLAYELIGVADSSGEPFVVSEVLTKSLAKSSTLAGRLASWGVKPEGGRLMLSQLLSRPALLSIVHKRNTESGREFAVIQTIQGWHRNRPVPKASHPCYSWDIDTAVETPSVPWLPFTLGRSVTEWITDSLEWKTRHNSRGKAPAPPAPHNGAARQEMGAEMDALITDKNPRY
jgi:hypothetical protein